MKPEEKQALIEWLKPQIDELQNVSDEIPFGLDADSEMHLNTMRVALAALTAQPVKSLDLSSLDGLAGKFLQNAISNNGKVSSAYSECAHLLATEVKAIRAAGYEVQE